MKKLYISILSIILCTQNIQSMELTTPPSNDCGYQIITKSLKDRPQPISISTKLNPLSEKLYDNNITDIEIRELVKTGAELNHAKSGDYPLMLYYAVQNGPQGVKNMKTIIELGAAIHNIKGEEDTPLTIALQYNGRKKNGEEKKDLTDMIQLLITYEKPTVTIYEDNRYDENGEWEGNNHDYSEREIREYIISQSFKQQNIAAIKSLLDLKLMTANRGLKEFVSTMEPNQPILNLLLSYGAQNIEDALLQIMSEASKYKKYSEKMRTMAQQIVYLPTDSDK